MGNTFSITAVAEAETFAMACIDKAFAEISRIENLLTTFNEESQTALINRNAGLQPVPVAAEVWGLVERSIRISLLTDGAFDITYGSIDKSLWNFDTRMKALPDAATALKAVRLINFRNIELDKEKGTVFLKEKGMRIGFGGIGKGYAAERARQLLQTMGIHNGVVNASGDLATWGHQPGGDPWTIGIAAPDGSHHLFSQLAITDMAVATSGYYEKYVVIDGKRYAHTINPKTGLPVSGIKSVTVICPYAEMADALTTPVMVMGIKAGLHLMNQVRGVHCLIIDENDQVFTTNNINIV